MKINISKEELYNFCVNEWGTKWNTCNHEIIEFKNGFKFDTAWSPPIPIIIALSKKFPRLSFIIKFIDEGGGFIGFAGITDGCCDTDCSHGWNTDAGKKLREELWGPDED